MFVVIALRRGQQQQRGARGHTLVQSVEHR